MRKTRHGNSRQSCEEMPKRQNLTTLHLKKPINTRTPHVCNATPNTATCRRSRVLCVQTEFGALPRFVRLDSLLGIALMPFRGHGRLAEIAVGCDFSQWYNPTWG